MKWIKIGEDLPENNKLVLIAYKNDRGVMLITMGWYCRKHEVEVDFDIEDDFDYCEDKDQYFVKEGWRSQCLESEWYYTISNVCYWMPLPSKPLN